MWVQDVEMLICLLSSVESSPCKLANSILKVKLKSNNLVDLQNLSPNIVVFGLELCIFWSWFRLLTWKCWFPKFRIFRGERDRRADDHEISAFFASNSYENINFNQIKNMDTNLIMLMIILFLFIYLFIHGIKKPIGSPRLKSIGFTSKNINTWKANYLQTYKQ